MVEALRTIKVKQLSGPELNLTVNPDVSVNKIGQNHDNSFDFQT